MPLCSTCKKDHGDESSTVSHLICDDCKATYAVVDDCEKPDECPKCGAFLNTAEDLQMYKEVQAVQLRHHNANTTTMLPSCRSAPSSNAPRPA